MDINIDQLDFDVIRLIDETGEYMQYNLKEELSINDSNYRQEMLAQASKYVYWSAILERIRLFQESSELELELLEARLDKDAREAITQEGGKPTKDSVEAYIKRQLSYEDARKKINTYNYLVKRLQFIVKSFEQRKDMLQSYGKQIQNDQNYGRGAGSYNDPSAPYTNEGFNNYPGG